MQGRKLIACATLQFIISEGLLFGGGVDTFHMKNDSKISAPLFLEHVSTYFKESQTDPPPPFALAWYTFRIERVPLSVQLKNN